MARRLPKLRPAEEEEDFDDSPAVTESEDHDDDHDDPMASDDEEAAYEEQDDDDDENDDDDDDADRRPTATAPPTLRAKKLAQQQRAPLYDAEAMHDRLEDIAWVESEGVTWAETLAITSTTPSCPQDLDVDDDLARELCFYNQALGAAQDAVARFEAAGVAWHRPADYYAEMVKSDEHMAKVKDRLMYEQQTIEQAEERRKAREHKAFAKQASAAKQRERAQEKKRAIEAVSALRKQRARTGFAGELDDEAAVHGKNQTKGGGQGGGGGQHQGRMAGPGGRQQALGFKPGERIRRGDGPSKGKKRLARDAKYGFGGRKRLGKQNDARSAADMSDYKPGKFRDQFGGGGGRGKGGVGKKKFGGGGGGGGGARPGKARRQQQRGGGGGRR